MSDKWAIFWGILGLVGFFLVIGLVIWARVAAPCEWIDWLPIADAPVRCLK